MIRSMTAFARVSAPARGGRWALELRSVNHRYFEFSLKLPPALGALETPIREWVQSRIRRGKITLAVAQDSEREKTKGVSLDEEAVRLYLGAIGKLKKRFKLAGEPAVGDLLKLPGIFTAETPEENPETVWPGLKKILTRVLDQAIKAKELEGGKLAVDIRHRLDAIAKALEKIERHAQGQTARVFQKLSERVNQLVMEKEMDADRLAREAAFLADRADITEEIVRLKSHLELFQSRLKGDGEVGRELDFLCQEMNREINTVGSKAQLFEISTEVVFVKGELEKIREQIQNIE